MARYALKVAYVGTRFHGSQAQPTHRTVHGEIEAALRKLGTEEPELRWAGRTDAGVSARGNVVAVRTDFPRGKLLQALTRNAVDVWAWALADVDDRFDPRRDARARRYRYHLRSDLDAAALRAALAPFVGTHDFSGFARVEPGHDPRRTVTAIEVRRQGPFLVVDVEGESFLWNQIRRMVEAARRVAAGDLPSDVLARTLAAGEPAELGTAPPYPLVLMDVEYERIAFEAGDPRLFEKLRWRDQDLEMERAVLGAILP